MPYTPPEVFDRKHDQYDYSQDMFSFGILAYLLILGQEPYSSGRILEEAY